jgi:hypothetical protein
MVRGWLWLYGAGFSVLLNFHVAQHELSRARTVFKTANLNEVGLGRIIGFIQIFPRDFDQTRELSTSARIGHTQNRHPASRP